VSDFIGQARGSSPTTTTTTTTTNNNNNNNNEYIYIAQNFFDTSTLVLRCTNRSRSSDHESWHFLKSPREAGASADTPACTVFKQFQLLSVSL